MNKDLQEIIDIVEKMQWQYDNDIANINDKKYHLVDKDLLKYIRNLEKENAKQKELIDKIKETIREKPIDYALGTEVIIGINYLIKEYEDDSKTNV